AALRGDPEMGENTCQSDADHDRDRPNPHPFGGCAGCETESSGKAMQGRTKATVNQLISRVELTPKILRYEEEADENTSNQVAEHNLQESEIAIVCQSGNANDRQRTGFSRDYRKGDCPPGNVAVRKEVTLERTIGRTKMNSK